MTKLIKVTIYGKNISRSAVMKSAVGFVYNVDIDIANEKHNLYLEVLF